MTWHWATQWLSILNKWEYCKSFECVSISHSCQSLLGVQADGRSCLVMQHIRSLMVDEEGSGSDWAAVLLLICSTTICLLVLIGNCAERSVGRESRRSCGCCKKKKKKKKNRSASSSFRRSRDETPSSGAGAGAAPAQSSNRATRCQLQCIA